MHRCSCAADWYLGSAFCQDATEQNVYCIEKNGRTKRLADSNSIHFFCSLWIAFDNGNHDFKWWDSDNIRTNHVCIKYDCAWASDKYTFFEMATKWRRIFVNSAANLNELSVFHWTNKVQFELKMKNKQIIKKMVNKNLSMSVSMCRVIGFVRALV